MSSAFELLLGATIFTKLDLCTAYHLVRIREGDECLVMPFGLSNSPAVFQALVNDVLRDMVDRFVFVYRDDILIFSQNERDHVQHVRRVLQQLLENRLFAKLEKCQFYAQPVPFLGFIISLEGIRMDPKHSNELSSIRSHCFFHRTTNWMLNSQVSGVAIQLRLRYSQSLKPCELQKPIPNHQSSSCWICLPLLTLSIIRSSCPTSHHWTSLGFHFAGLNPISLIGLSGWPGEGRYPKHINWSLGFPRDRFLDPSFSPHTLNHWLPYRHVASPTISTLMTHSSISHFDQMIQR